MDFAVLVAWACADSIPCMFVGPYAVAHMYRQNQELLQGGGKAGIQRICLVWTPTPSWLHLSFTLE